MPMHDMLKRKKYAKKIKAKRIKMLLKMVVSVFLEDVGVIGCGSYRIYLEGDSLYQVVLIVCELN